MRYSSKLIVLAGVLLILLVACKPESCDTTVPIIKYESFIQFQDSSGLLKITFEDCDGDMGLKDEDSLPPFAYNLFLDYFEMRDGQWVELVPCDSPSQTTPPCLPFPFYYRIPYIEPEGQHKRLEGEIEVAIEPFYFNIFSVHSDSIKFEIALQDRALQKSNVVSTPMLIVPK